MKRTAPTEATGSILAVGWEGKMEIMDQYFRNVLKFKLFIAIRFRTAICAATLCLLTAATAPATVMPILSQVNPSNGHTYHLLADRTGADDFGLTWQAAEDYAVNVLGGHLATVDSSDLNSWIWSTFGGTATHHYWIGLTDEVAEGAFVWVGTGAAAAYLNWYPGEPNNWEDEDFALVLASGFGTALWNDAQGTCTTFQLSSADGQQIPIFAVAESDSSGVPEPSTNVLIGGALALLAAFRLRGNVAAPPHKEFPPAEG